MDSLPFNDSIKNIIFHYSIEYPFLEELLDATSLLTYKVELKRRKKPEWLDWKIIKFNDVWTVDWVKNKKYNLIFNSLHP